MQFRRSEFAAHITAVNTGKASREYQDSVAFYERTFITEGMGLLLTQVAQRLAGKGGEPVVRSRLPSEAARRTRCWRCITWPLASALCPTWPVCPPSLTTLA